jgi:hypothetical protein
MLFIETKETFEIVPAVAEESIRTACWGNFRDICVFFATPFWQIVYCP